MDLLGTQKTEVGVTHSVTDTKVKPRRKSRKREYIPRRTRKFQLRTTHAEDMHVGEILDYARSQRQEVTMIRQGVALEYSLQRGDVSILLERHPWILEALKPLIAPPPTSDGGGQLDDINAKLELLLANQQSNNGYTMASQPAQRPNELVMQSGNAKPLTPSTGKQIAAPAFEMPTFDDDDNLPTLKLSTNTSINSAQNLVNCVFGLTH